MRIIPIMQFKIESLDILTTFKLLVNDRIKHTYSECNILVPFIYLMGGNFLFYVSKFHKYQLLQEQIYKTKIIYIKILTEIIYLFLQ